jgi:hypothetical protein
MHLLLLLARQQSRKCLLSVFVCERARRRAVRRGGRWKGKGAPPPPLFASNARDKKLPRLNRRAAAAASLHLLRRRGTGLAAHVCVKESGVLAASEAAAHPAVLLLGLLEAVRNKRGSQFPRPAPANQRPRPRILVPLARRVH